MINITTDIEAILTQFARAIPDLYLDFDREAIQVVQTAEDGVFDIVLVLSEDNEEEEELVLGEMVLSADFDLTYEIFED